jgi:hypothetical protein
MQIKVTSTSNCHTQGRQSLYGTEATHPPIFKLERTLARGEGKREEGTGRDGTGGKGMVSPNIPHRLTPLVIPRYPVDVPYHSSFFLAIFAPVNDRPKSRPAKSVALT